MKKLIVLAAAFFVYASVSAQTTSTTSSKPTSKPVQDQPRIKDKVLTEGPKVKAETTPTKVIVKGEKENVAVKQTNPAAGKPNASQQKNDKAMPVKKDKGLNNPEPKPKQSGNK